MVVTMGGLGNAKHETRAGFGMVTKNGENIIQISFRSLNLWRAVYDWGQDGFCSLSARVGPSQVDEEHMALRLTCSPW